MKTNNPLSHPFSQAEHVGGPELPAGHEKKQEYPIIVDDQPVKMTDPVVTGQAILEKAGKLPLSCFALYIKRKGCDFEKIGLHDKIGLREPGIEHFVTKEPNVYPYYINNDPELTAERALTPRQMMQNAGLNPDKVYLVMKDDQGQERVLAFVMDEPIRMHCKGLQFVTREWMQEVSIEYYGKTCTPVPPARLYLVKVDKEIFRSATPTVTAEALIRFIVKDNPANYTLIKFLSSTPKPVPVGFTAVVDLTEKCLLRFVVQPKTQNDGERRNFSLPEVDIQFLNEMGFQWEALSENRYLWLLIHNYSLPEGYQTKECSVALMIPPAYPAAEIDMAYFHPQLSKVTGRSISATSMQTIDQKPYQRWSRHRRPGDWKPGVDNVATHLLLVNNWLENDTKR